MCDRSRCKAPISCNSEETRWPNLASAIELDYSTGGCSRYDDLVTSHPRCLDPNTWPKDTCNKPKQHENCREHLAKVQKAVARGSTSIPQKWPSVERTHEPEWPTQMCNDDERKYHIPGYSGHVPRQQFGPKFGTFSLMSHKSLNEFSDAQQGICEPDACVCPPDHEFERKQTKYGRTPSCHIGCGMVPRCEP